MKVKLIALTRGVNEEFDEWLTENGIDPNSAEGIVAFCARVSSPANQDNYNTAPKLLRYLVANKHWSPLEMANMVIEIETGRDVAPQILRHRSFSFQEFSQRYAVASMGYQEREARKQDLKNRQNSTDDLPDDIKIWFKNAQEVAWQQATDKYEYALSRGIAKECARSLLPLNTTTKMYMNGTLRSWAHYIDLRSANGTQKEHQDIALAVKAIFCEQFPNIAKALEWN